MTTSPLAPFTKSMFLAFAGVESSSPRFAVANCDNGAETEGATLILDGTRVELYLLNEDGSDSIWSKEYPEGEATAECVALGLLSRFEPCETNGQLIAILEQFAFEQI